ncbi:MAG: TIGR04348 family glycosyltransferase [Betaproteobacteria bacterium]|nr:TIGR04348 family glycosyltransferase [Betaproteobacteria bacterium]MSQ88554.1 TIGR04348 family glycosyltransferase [Betaproteobacteria bacterium]
MAHICIVTPARAGTRNGNRHTALRWAGLLRALGQRVSVMVEWDRKPCDLMLALHARRSHASVLEYRQQYPQQPLVVTLTGTDLYRDLPASREARQSLQLANRVIVLQEDALHFLDAKTRKKADIVYQSAKTAVRHSPPKKIFRVAVVGHLREEKDPFRTALALPHLQQDLQVVQVGDALSPLMKLEAEKHMQSDARYRWLGGRTHAQTLGWIARSHLLVVSSVMEGGANVISEAARIGTPVLASHMSGNVGMLGRNYPGYFPLFDEQALSSLIRKNIEENESYQLLKRALAARRRLFAPTAERAALARVLCAALERGA